MCYPSAVIVRIHVQSCGIQPEGSIKVNQLLIFFFAFPKQEIGQETITCALRQRQDNFYCKCHKTIL